MTDSREEVEPRLRELEGLAEALRELQAQVEGCRGALEAYQAIHEHVAADISATHSRRGDAASEWMREDDRDLRRDFRAAGKLALAALAKTEDATGSMGSGGEDGSSGASLPAGSQATAAVCHAEPSGAEQRESAREEGLAEIATDLREALADCLAEMSPLMHAYRPEHAEAICGRARGDSPG